MKLYYAAPSTYSRKALIAFYEKEIEFTPELVNLMDKDSRAAYRKLNPIGKVPLLVLEDGYMVPESTSIIEYIDQKFDTGTKLISKDPDTARLTRFMDRMNDLYLSNSFGTIFFDGMKPDDKKDPEAVVTARERIAMCYHHMDNAVGQHDWLVEGDFSMADCAAIPALAYLKDAVPFDDRANLNAYWNRVTERPSVQKMFKLVGA